MLVKSFVIYIILKIGLKINDFQFLLNTLFYSLKNGCSFHRLVFEVAEHRILFYNNWTKKVRYDF